jgi:hypothetical protein
MEFAVLQDRGSGFAELEEFTALKNAETSWIAENFITLPGSKLNNTFAALHKNINKVGGKIY